MSYEFKTNSTHFVILWKEKNLSKEQINSRAAEVIAVNHLRIIVRFLMHKLARDCLIVRRIVLKNDSTFAVWL